MPTQAQRDFYDQLEREFGWISTWKAITRNRDFAAMSARRAYWHLARLMAGLAPFFSMLPERRDERPRPFAIGARPVVPAPPPVPQRLAV